jgi:hypothetical protein
MKRRLYVLTARSKGRNAAIHRMHGKITSHSRSSGSGERANRSRNPDANISTEQAMSRGTEKCLLGNMGSTP